MSATLTLEENGHILHYVLQDPVSVAEIKLVEQQANDWYDKAQGKIHTLMDLGSLHSLPNGILQFRGTKGLSHPHAGETVVLVASMYVQAIAEMFIKLTRNNHIHFFRPTESQKAWNYLHGLITDEDRLQLPGHDPVQVNNPTSRS